MKFGASYNVYEDSVEILPYSLQSIRESVDYIVIVYQTTSNWDIPASEAFVPELERLKAEGLCDELFCFDKRPAVQSENEVDKRNIGFNLCRDNGCDYAINMDSDELYIKEEFERMKQITVDGNHDGGACKMLSYYKTSEYIRQPLEEYYVPLFYRVSPGRHFRMCAGFPVLVDPTRGMDCNNVRLFEREEIQMHHMTYVRKDIKSKVLNSTARPNYDGKIDAIISNFENFDGINGNFAGVTFRLLKLENPPFKISF
jgi:glycosyltransferase involved in cell wall biosynthesis